MRRLSIRSIMAVIVLAALGLAVLRNSAMSARTARQPAAREYWPCKGLKGVDGRWLTARHACVPPLDYSE
jgi:hypothetical protein